MYGRGQVHVSTFCQRVAAAIKILSKLHKGQTLNPCFSRAGIYCSYQPSPFAVIILTCREGAKYAHMKGGFGAVGISFLVYTCAQFNTGEGFGPVLKQLK